jgi:hypothetical protein
MGALLNVKVSNQLTYGSLATDYRLMLCVTVNTCSTKLSCKNHLGHVCVVAAHLCCADRVCLDE